MIKKLLFVFGLTCGIAVASQAQVYRTAAGVRLDGDVFGVTVQQKLHEKGTLEGIFAVSAREYSGTALYEWHRRILGKRFNYYLGAGGHVGNLKDHGAFGGLDLIGGIEYKVNGLPFLLSTDIKPAVHFNHEDWTDFSTGISIRYVIVKEKKKKKSIWPFNKKEDDATKKGKEEGKGSILDIFKRKEN
ncbi:hypothetical protein ACFSKU_17465 [Pontibacter silvestris]|uniref:Outer membrane protein beta-barrel domain-containing protein n=1 Tax=Pontibacter silvestris TaxID=2305183 RepID=A0ABW4X3E9_9BACT|nr:hypothetical protein [Pontibacter silvestris]MCC9135813.1 hypothetical protein [Pontibacter silvestris]